MSEAIIEAERRSLDELAAQLVGARVGVGVTDPQLGHGGLFREELAQMPRAVDRRRREYAAGRVAAHRAMERLGLPAAPVLSGEDRAPIWPVGMVGSLSHTEEACIAAVARAGDLASLGVDIEVDTPLDSDLFESVCTLEERAWLASCSPPRRGRLAKLIFSAKEAVFKCQYPITRRLIDFTAVLVTPDLDTGQFEATFLCEVPPFATGERLGGRFGIDGGTIMTVVKLRHDRV